jgi:hypothetical protein
MKTQFYVNVLVKRSTRELFMVKSPRMYMPIDAKIPVYRVQGPIASVVSVSAAPEPATTEQSQPLPAQNRAGFVRARDRASSRIRFAPLLATLAAGASAALALAESSALQSSGLGLAQGKAQPYSPWGAGQLLALPTQKYCEAVDSAHQSIPAVPQKIFGRWNLFGASGQPRASDIEQTLDNCWFVAALGSLAKQCPQRIFDSIKIDPDTGSVKVRLFGVKQANAFGHVRMGNFERFRDKKAVWIELTPHDIEDHLQRGITRTSDSDTAPLWPNFFQAALAKAMVPRRNMLAQALLGPANLDDGYSRSSEGAPAYRAVELLTGKSPVHIDFQTHGQLATADKARRINRVYRHLQKTLKEGCIVVVSIDPEQPATSRQIKLGMATGVKDGLTGAHVYMVEGVHLNEQGQQCVTLRDPMGYHVNLERTQYQLHQVTKHADGTYSPVVEGPLVVVPLATLYEAGTVSMEGRRGGSFSGLVW